MSNLKKFYFTFEDINDPEAVEASLGNTIVFIVEQQHYDKEGTVDDNHNLDEVLQSIPDEMRDTFEDHFDEIMENTYETDFNPSEIREYFSYLACFEEAYDFNKD